MLFKHNDNKVFKPSFTGVYVTCPKSEKEVAEAEKERVEVEIPDVCNWLSFIV